MPSERLFKNVSILLMLLLAGAASWAILSRDGESSGTQNDLQAPEIGAGAPIPVQVAPAARKDLVVRIGATGRTRAAQQLVITAQVNGRVARVPVQEGQEVSAGALLFAIDDTDYKLDLKSAEEQLTAATLQYGEKLGERRGWASRPADGETFLNLQEAENAYARAKQNFAKGLIDESALQLAEREYAAAKLFNDTSKKSLIASRTGLNRALVEFERARLKLTRTKTTAPFSGVVGDIKIAPGMQVATGAECLTLVNLDHVLVDIQILESELAQVQTGRKATATFTAFPGRSFAGKVVSVNPLIDPEKKTRRATIRIENPEHKLLPGMHAFVKLDAQIYKNRLLVPREAVVLRDQRPVVFIAREDAEGKLRAVWSYVTLGRQNEEYVEIVSSKFNLKEGEQVVVSNHYTMVHDALIRVIP